MSVFFPEVDGHSNLIKARREDITCDKVIITYKLVHAFIWPFILVIPNSYVIIFATFNLKVCYLYQVKMDPNRNFIRPSLQQICYIHIY